jgi:3alpha(or 20beta)-hydroxysteroid dehydrogenase
MARFTGRIAIVTGGARFMGATTAKLLAAEGATVVVADILEKEGQATVAEIGGNSMFFKLDVGNETAWQALAKEVETRFGRADVLVNNAGMLHFAPLLQTKLEDIERILRVNLLGTFLGMKTIAPLMIKGGKGAIVNISSVDGLKGSNSMTAYAASKWGVRGITKVAALELGHQGVRVNSVHPGGVNTPMSNPNNLPAAELSASYTAVPLQRIGETEEIARASVFLASDDASYINGAELAVDGGWSAGIYHTFMPGAPGVP